MGTSGEMAAMQMRMNNSLRNENGYALAVVVVVTAVLLVSLSEAMINWQKAMQREREEELIFRGKQFIRAIDLWQRKFPRTYPTTIDALLNTNNTRFLRKKWKDPITNSDEWRLIKMNPDGSISGLVIVSGEGLPEAGATSQNRRGTPSPSTPGEQSQFPSSSTSLGIENNAQSASSSQSLGSQSSSQSSGSSRTGQSRSSSLQSSSSPVLGGIIGVASTSKQKTLKTYNGRSRYNEWEFYYVPRLQPQPNVGPVQGQQPSGARPGAGPGAARGVSSPQPSAPASQQPQSP
jgi:type II secretory pathway pseudopilin PulG